MTNPIFNQYGAGAVASLAPTFSKPPRDIAHVEVIVRVREDNPMLHRVHEPLISDSTGQLVHSKSELTATDEFLDMSVERRDRIYAILKSYIVSKFSVELSLPLLDSYVRDNIPESLQDYVADMDVVVPKIELSLIKQLYLDLAKELGCSPEIIEESLTVKPASPNSDLNALTHFIRTMGGDTNVQ